MSLPIDRTTKSALDTNLVNGNTSDAPVIKNSNDVVYNTIDELNNKVDGLVSKTALSPYPPAQYNQLINGNFDIWQRGTSLTLGSATSAYLADRFISQNNTSGANSTVSRVAITDLDGSSYGLQFVHAALPTGQGRINHLYTIEAADSYKLAGKTVTFSIKVKGVLAMNQVSVIARYNTTETGIGGASTFIASIANYTINNATWTTISFTFTCPNRATLTPTGVIGFQITASKTTSEANGDGFIVAQAQVNVGNVILPFQPRSIADELALCQRYYEKSYEYDKYAGNNYGVASGSVISATPLYYYNNSAANVNRKYTQTSFKVMKRIPPTINYYDIGGNLSKITTLDADGALVAHNISEAFQAFQASRTNLIFQTAASCSSYAIEWIADAEL